MFKRSIVIAGVIVFLLLVLAFSKWRSEEISISGTIEADEIRIGSLVGGRVERVLAEEGQPVEPGQVLVELAPYDLMQRKAEAEANVKSAKAELERLQTGFRVEEIAQAQAQKEQLEARLSLLVAGPRSQEIIAAEARLKAAEAEEKLAKSNFQRAETLFQKNAATEERFEEATEKLQAASAMNIVRGQELTLLQEGTRQEEITEAKAKLKEAEALLDLRQSGYRAEEIAQAEAAVNAAEAALSVIQQQIDELTIRAPMHGVVEALDLQPGDLVSPRAPVLSLLDNKKLWMRTFIPLNRKDLKLDQKVEVSIDSFPDETFTGQVTFISRDPEFTPSNAQTPEDRQKQVFRVKVTFIDTPDKLHPGMTGEIVLGRE